MKKQTNDEIEVQTEILDYNNISFCMQCMDYVVPDQRIVSDEVKIYCPVCGIEIEEDNKE